ncbi:MAG: hypothetical protein ACJ76N_02105 [Thermoanaerobaculia bacterium]
MVGPLELFDERLLGGLRRGESLPRSPQSLADLLEAAGQVALERAGAILDGRVPWRLVTFPTRGSSLPTRGSTVRTRSVRFTTRGSRTPQIGSAMWTRGS